MKPVIFKPAVFNGKYRYWLDRDLESGKGTYVWIGKNPSKADDDRNDGSVSRVMKRAKNNGFRKLVVVNLYAYVSTAPKELLDSWINANGPVGPKNLEYLQKALDEADQARVHHVGQAARVRQELIDRDRTRCFEGIGR